jgi:hypothetical protein
MVIGLDTSSLALANILLERRTALLFPHRLISLCLLTSVLAAYVRTLVLDILCVGLMYLQK